MKPLKISIRLRLIISLILMMTVIALTGCSDSKYHPSGRFLSAFSPDETVKRLNVPGLETPGASYSGDTSPGEPTRYRKEFVQEFRIKDTPGSRFDEHSFLLKLETAIKQEAQSANVRLTGGGWVGDSFHINYQDGGNQGAVEVIGARLENDRYKIWCIARELSVPNKN
ncbi:MAG TPA: hypothetical protein VFV58_37725 [Blastocatellia bacterium]|jgi:hypothetical protein|nr:hypothetical protein [Blastocatellia bacterium]